MYFFDSLLNLPLLFVRNAVAILVHILRAWQYSLSLVCYAYRLVTVTYWTLVTPVILEWRRFVTVFAPVELPWYHQRCLFRAVAAVGDYTYGQGHWLLYGDTAPMFSRVEHSFVEALQDYFSSPKYQREICVIYTSYFDLAVLLVALSVVSFIGYVIYKFLLQAFYVSDPLGRVLFSHLLSWLISRAIQPRVDVKTVRKMFATSQIVKLKLPSNHTHPLSAAVRSSSVSTIELICHQLGKRPYFFQKSQSDVRNGRVGARTYYWGKDVGVEAAGFEPKDDDVIVMIDVDMYVDMPDMLARHPHTYMISTFQPTTTGENQGEYTFSFDEEGRVSYVVSGGATYEHTVWNYSGDILTVSSRSIYLWSVTTTIYNIDRRQTDKHHQIICLTPMKTFTCPLFDLGRWLSGDKLERFAMADGGFNRLAVKKSDAIYVSTSKIGSTACATITSSDDDTISNLSSIGKVDLSLAQVKTVLDDTSSAEASILVEYHRQNAGKKTPFVFAAEESVKNYQYDPANHDPEAKAGVVPFMTPILDFCYAPVKSVCNDIACITGRLLEVQPPADLEITEFDKRLMEEFAELMVPESISGTGIPVDIDTVYDKQNRPTQRRLLDQGSMSTDLVSGEPIKSFQKGEVYGDIKDPRNISTVPPTQKLHYSAFMYAFTDSVLKSKRWYAFSKTPLEIAQTVASICTNALTASMTDLSRFDGRVSKILRTLESMVMQRWIHEAYKATIAELMASQKAQRGVTSFGVKYDTMMSRLSGSPETSSFNTMDNAFMAYKALRMTKKSNGEYNSKEEAWNALGVYGGDDGLTADVDSDSYVKACASVGQKLDIAEIKRGDLGVTFLSRYYSREVWWGSPDSCCDVKRQLAKLHVTPHLPANVSAFDKLHEKMIGYYMTDRNTPIIGEIACLVFDLYGSECPNNNLRNYFANHPDNVQYPNTDAGSWMYEVIESTLPHFDYEAFANWLHSVDKAGAQSKVDVLRPPICYNHDLDKVETKKPVVLNGDIVQPKTNPNPVVCKHISDGHCKYGDKCNHIVKKQKCFGTKCKFEHGKRSKDIVSVGSSESEEPQRA